MTSQSPEGAAVPPCPEDHLTAVQRAILDVDEAIIRLEERARHELTRAVVEKYLCADGTSKALANWAMQPLPTLWPVVASLTATVTVAGEDPDAARARGREEIRAAVTARFGPQTELLHLRTAISPPADGQQVWGAQASVTVQFGTKAVTRDGAIVNTNRLSQGTQDNVTLDVDQDGPRRIGNPIILTTELDPDTDAPITANPRPAAETVASLDDDTAREVLALRRSQLALTQAAIRTTTLMFVRSVHHVETVYERADVFLTGLGLAPLPRAYRIDLHATVDVLMIADTMADALTRCWQADQVAELPTAPRLDTDKPRLLPEAVHLGNHVWRQTFEHTMRAWIRDAADLDTARAQGVAAAADYLMRLRPPTQPVVTVTAVSPEPVIDHLLDPATD
ncbi:hypothetical protein GCM10009661_29270 [Catellatospora chokoriensis]|uniref:Uncharacterized protein n=1 Tax=Catellatospora chokoriensis TaxID=310353 RepID=A0A8J3NRV6_9ACTN|nr:hypothetical protein Cch02nite_32620 [Catellatospora chokoriensis]